MLTPEQAKAEVEKLRSPQWTRDVKKRIAALPKQDGEAAQMLLGPGSAKFKTWQAWQETQKTATEHLDRLPPERRLRVFEAAFPRLARHLENAWLYARTQPSPNPEPVSLSFRQPAPLGDTRFGRWSWMYSVNNALSGLDVDVVWLAKWAIHLSPRPVPHELSDIFIAAIDAGGDEGEQVFQIMLAAARGDHEIAQFGNHVIRTLLSCSRPEGWQTIEHMLLAAQRQEGLRQSILEQVHIAHPDAFGRMLKLILDENLVRFASVARAVDVWFGLRWDSSSMGVIRDTVASAVKYLDDEAARDKALRGDDPAEIYIALWTIAFGNAHAAVAPASQLLKHRKVDVRFTAAWLLLLLGIDEGRAALVPALDDEDLRVVNVAVTGMALLANACKADTKLFAKLRDLTDRTPRKAVTLKPLLWPWLKFTFKQSEVADLLGPFAGDEHVQEVAAYVPLMSPAGRMRFLHSLSLKKEVPADRREVLLKLAGDASTEVRSRAIDLLQRLKIRPDEAAQVENLLSRKPAGLRRGVLNLLLGQKDPHVLDSIDRLLASRNAMQREGGLDLLRLMSIAKRHADECHQRAGAYAAARPELSEIEHKFLDPILGQVTDKPTLDDALGLMDPTRLTRARPVRDRGVPVMTQTAVRILESLEKLIHKHRETPIEVQHGNNISQELLGTARSIQGWSGEPGKIQRHPIALEEIWREWERNRPADLRDADGLELFRAHTLSTHYNYFNELEREASHTWEHLGLTPSKKLSYRNVSQRVLSWLLEQSPVSHEQVIQMAETACATVPTDVAVGWIRGYRNPYGYPLSRVVGQFYAICDEVNDEQIARLVQLGLWRDMPVDTDGCAIPLGDWPRDRIDPLLLAHGVRLGILNEHDVYDHLVGPRPDGHPFSTLIAWSASKGKTIFKVHPPLEAMMDGVRERVLEIELARGDQPTAASAPAQAIKSVRGAAVLIRVLRALSETSLDRRHESDWRNNLDRDSVFSHLIRVCMPAAEDTPGSFAAMVKEAGIGQARLVELAVFAPQWAKFVEHALGWEGFEDGVWWLHAHTKERHWFGNEEVLEQWTRQIADRTALTTDDLLEGGVDVAWFNAIYERLGKKRWGTIYDAAKLASTSAGHKRAQLFADAMLGAVSKTELVQRITNKRYQDAVRALGLLPLARGKGRDKDLLGRYEVMQEMRRTSRQFGSQRQLSEKRCVEIGQANLARTAGFSDPLRLQWAMEARAVADLADGPAEATVGDVKVALSIDDDGEPQVVVTRGGKELKAIPPAAKKDKNIKALSDRRTSLRRQSSRMRQSLEMMMCRGDAFTAAELADFMKHPLMRPLLRRLVVISDDAKVIGYPAENGRTLTDAAGKVEPLGKADVLRLAHPHDMLRRGDWSAWQRDCFAAERVQPFKQLFRELYVVTYTERSEGTVSRRYEGQQVNPAQAVALLAGRGWLVAPDEGVRKTFHDRKLTAWITFQEGFSTPAEVDGLTVESVQFTRRGEYRTLKLDDVPPAIFSEVMRDVDLVVSVAHRGGVDPEASASTVQMRSDLLRETLAVLSYENVRIEKHHALIAGSKARYTVHLGSAVSHVMPGGALFIVPVHSQHRGRLFLPFADDDPKTAEVISKVLLLARDEQIKDPSLLDQIRVLS